MVKTNLLFFLGLLALARSYPNPQSFDSVLQSINNADLDGDAETNLSDLDLAAIFGTPEKPYTVIDDSTTDDETAEEAFETVNDGVPKDIIVDDTSKQCASYNESGYRCVPYYSCDGGEIIIDGAGLFNPRFGGLDDVELNPETSKCPGSFEMCCRHPDWIGLPILTPVPIHKPPEDVLVNHDDNDNLNDILNGNPSQPINQPEDPYEETPDYEETPEVKDPTDPYDNDDLGTIIDIINEGTDNTEYPDDKGVDSDNDGVPDTAIIDNPAANPNAGGEIIDITPTDEYGNPIIDNPAANPNAGPEIIDIQPTDEDGNPIIDNPAANPNGGIITDIIPTDEYGNPIIDTDNESGYPDIQVDPVRDNTIPDVLTAPGYVPQCGQRNSNGIGVRIHHNSLKDTSTQFGEWPHMCAVLNKTEIAGTEHNLYVCGGSLIAPNVVLTAAHCVDSDTDASRIRVRCGEWDTQDEVEPIIHQDREALSIMSHPAFEKRSLDNDFAIIVLYEPFVLDRHVDTICLPDQFNKNVDWENCVATGWGKDKFGADGEYQVVMKQVEMDMVDHDTCQSKLRTTRLGQFFELDKSFNCAGGDADKDTCQGDGGGPLVCPGYDGYYHQTGIIAWGVECGIDGVPGVYANVTEGLDFIDYATRCVLGQDQDLYGITGTKRWAKRKYCELKDEFDQISELVEDNKLPLKEKGKLFRKRRDIGKVLAKYETAAKDCSGEEQVDCLQFDYYPEEEDYDISVLAKMGDSEEKEE